MAATAKAVPDEVKMRRWETFINGFAVDQGEYEEPEPEVDVDVDSDFEYERVAVGAERNAHARVEEEGIPAAAARHCEEEEEELPGDGHVRLQAGLLAGTKRKAAGEHDEPPTTKAAIQDGKEEYTAEDSYGQIGAGLLQGRNMEATVTASKLQPATGPEIHDEQWLGYKKDHQVLAEEENVGMVTSKIDSKMMAAAQAPVEEPSSGAACHCDDAEEYVPEHYYVQLQGGLLGRKRNPIVTHAEPQTTGKKIQKKKCHEEEVSGDCYVRLQGGLLGRKRKASVTRSEPQITGTYILDKQGQGEHISDDNDAPTGVGLQGRKRGATVTPVKAQRTTGHDKSAQGESLRVENEMLRQQLVRKTKELEAEQIRRLKLELDKDKEIESLEKQNEELRAENECYRKTVSSIVLNKAFRLSPANPVIQLSPSREQRHQFWNGGKLP